MNDQPLPDFDFPPQPSAQPAPKKPRSASRRRPAKKAVKRAAPAPKPAKRVAKKRRVRKTSSILTEAPVLLLPDEAYKLIRGLMGMSKAQLTLVMEIVHKLTK